jgi:hypothetical protein
MSINKHNVGLVIGMLIAGTANTVISKCKFIPPHTRTCSVAHFDLRGMLFEPFLMTAAR